MIASKQIAFGKAAGAKKPYDAEIEYLESTGSQYIDTGLTPQLSSDVWEIDLQRLQRGTIPWGCLNYTESASYGRYFSATGIVGFNPNIVTDRTSLKVDAPQKKIFHNNAEISGITDYSKYFTAQAEGRLWLFGRSDTGALGICRIYAVKCFRNGVLLLDLTPVRKGNVGYMYDRVSGQLFGNQGTGEFVLGPDL